MIRQYGARRPSNMNDEGRKHPEDFLDPAPQAGKGRLKVYLGGAAGVGKTYRMLEEVSQLRQQGRDVVIGFVETHGRAETAARIGDVELVPLRKLPYRGVTLEEMDVDAIIARRPELAIVDELPHTNVSGSRHSKRYQDVEELIANGIGVITAFNVQHLESLNEVVHRITGIEVRETIPDAFLAHADQVVTVDLPVEELRQRLRDGKIYPPDRVEQALKNFFKQGNLAALRELALREVARDQSRQREEFELLKREGGRRTALGERLMVCLSANPDGGEDLLRKAARTATQLNAEWYAVHVETPDESAQKISTSDFRALLDNVNLAAALGGEVVWLKAIDVIKALLEFAREKTITRIVVGRTHPTLWNRLLGRSVTSRLLAAAPDFNIEVVGHQPPPSNS
ncbi:MAG TPA: universal stress protein [Candidatus Binataceae bacterium]|jgi:two-component system sensor histidine kinase KdpD|nr:universal stress protein [Candidatus Binataceae bacterium]